MDQSPPVSADTPLVDHHRERGALRVAIVSHGHPDLSRGGTQTASYAQFLALKKRPGIDAVYVAQCEPGALGHSGPFASFRGRVDELLWSPPGTDPFRLISAAPEVLERNLLQLFAHIDPDIVHLHHFAGFGTDICRSLPQRPDVRVVLTLHEYMAICHRSGAMVKTNGQLCYESSFAECSACFPAISAGKFFLRKQMLMENFSNVDAFIAPSHFLRERFVAWGLDASRIRTIENPGDERHASVSRSPAEAKLRGGPTRIGYFGQLTPFKGVDVLLDAMALLDPVVKGRVKLTLFGFELPTPTGGEAQPIVQKLDGLKGFVVNHGPYRNEEVIRFMRSVDWIVVPSIWWENSPVVIQEAKAAGVPVLCSNIGGMREKVRPGIDGEHFDVANPIELADRITAIATGRLNVNPTPGQSGSSPIDDLLSCYYEISAKPKSRGGVASGAGQASVTG